MTFKLSFGIFGDASSGKKALEETAAAAAKTKGALQNVAPAADKVGQATAAMGRANQTAAGSVGNLTAQFNDIGVMLMAGQNPLQLAIQQGTQITQVIGPMGAAGAVRALGSALIGMLNPVSLVTIGSIAAGAAMIQWLTGSSKEAEIAQKAVTALQKAVDAYTAASKRAAQSSAQLGKEFGSQTAAARQLLREQAAQAEREATQAAKTASAALQDSLRITGPKEIGDQKRLADLFDLSLFSRAARGEINAIFTAFDRMDRSRTLDQQLVAAQALQARFQDVAAAVGGISDEEQGVLDQINAQVLALTQLKAARENAARVQFTEQVVEPAQKAFGALVDRGAELVQANDILTTLRQEADLRAVMLQYGEGSVQLARARYEAERAGFEQSLADLNLSEGQAAAMLAQWERGNVAAALNRDIVVAIGERLAAAANANLAGVFSQAQGPANTLLGTVTNILNQWAAVAAAQAQYGPSGVIPGTAIPKGKYTPGGMDNVARGEMRERPLVTPVATYGVNKPVKVKAGGGGGDKSAGPQRDALQDLIAREQDELALLKETDPVQKEMLRNRKALAGATEAERTTVQGLIEERIREQEALKSLQAQREFYTDTAYGAIEQMVFEGGKLSDVFDNATEAFGRMALKAIWLGEGPLAGLFNGGSTGGGGLLGSLFSAILPAAAGGLPAKAEGGYLTGPGGGKSDDILMWGSAGEFMVNAKATAKHRAMLETINAGGLPSFASGGMIGRAGAAAAAVPGGASGGRSVVEIRLAEGLRASILQEAQGQAVEVVKAGISQFDSKVLPQRVGQISRNPRKVGA